MSSRVRPKLGSHICASTSCRAEVSASRWAKRPTKEPADSSKFFQYGSVASTERSGSEATESQSLTPWGPSVSGSRQIVFLPPREATCAVTSPRKSTTDLSRNCCTSGVRPCDRSSPDSSTQTWHTQAHRFGSATPTCSGTVQCGSAQKTESVPASRAASAHSLQNTRYPGLLRQPVGKRPPPANT